MKQYRRIYTLLFTIAFLLSCNQKKNNNDPLPTDEENNITTIENTEINDAKEKVEDAVENVETEINEIKPDHYICFKGDKNPDMVIWVSFGGNKGKALQVKYKGQQEAIDLEFVRESLVSNGAHPTIDYYYNEIYNGKVNGVYKHTHSGAWDYIEYTRNKDGKKFTFTIDHESDPYGKTPCFDHNNNASAVSNLSLKVFEGFPIEIDGCSTYFSLNRGDFKKSKFIYVDDIDAKAAIHINDELVVFQKLNEQRVTRDSMVKVLQNDKYRIQIKTAKISQTDETVQHKGTIEIEDLKNASRLIQDIIGEFGC
ncbi:hypothetical protein [Aquimarina algicola]|uniref:hypothetical protein n=1 Tax=Aquimarina algicola TaxID=2589995 RepID=UPI001CF36959|nr:hypothetical protein [Aquimarina algicola]